MEILVSDCLPPIFSYLSLSDLLNLRTVSRRLKQEVEDYLPNVRSLPLYLTTRRTPEEIAKYNKMFDFSFRNRNLAIPMRAWCDADIIRRNEKRIRNVRQLSFGTSGQETFEDRTILQNQSHFRLADFLILNHSSAIPKFLPFIKELCPNIEKLAIVIDNSDHYLPEVSSILETFPVIKVLLLENTLQDACRTLLNHCRSKDYLNKLLNREHLEQSLELPGTMLSSILQLESLEELFLFSKQLSNLNIQGEWGIFEENFLRPLGRLRVLHLNTARDKVFNRGGFVYRGRPMM